MATVKLPRRAAAVGVISVLLAGCGASGDATTSDEYVALSGERDSLRDELDQMETKLDEVDDSLAVAEARASDTADELADAQSRLDAADEVAADFESLLQLDLVARVGMTSEQADCVAAAFVDDAEARQSYLFLLDPGDASEDERTTAYETIATVFETCGLQLQSADEETTATTETTQPLIPLSDVLGDVTVTGDVLPDLPDSGDDPAIGLTAPVVTGADYDGNPVTIDATTDGPTMVIVLAHWCPHCNAEVPRINQLRDEGRIPDGVQIAAVSSGVSPDRPNYPPDEWITDVGWTFPVIADGPDATGGFAGAGAYGTTGFPFVVLLDGDGVVVDRWAGERDITDLESALQALAS